MVRQRNTNKNGYGWTEQEKQAVWNQSIGSMYSRGYDRCGALVKYNQHGMNNQYGWEIDHIIPVAKGGGDELRNLQVLQWENNKNKSDSTGNWYCERGNKRIC